MRFCLLLAKNELQKIDFEKYLNIIIQKIVKEQKILETDMVLIEKMQREIASNSKTHLTMSTENANEISKTLSEASKKQLTLKKEKKLFFKMGTDPHTIETLRNVKFAKLKTTVGAAFSKAKEHIKSLDL
jgi:hypothetical protein